MSKFVSAVAVSVLNARHISTLFENSLHFSHLADVERELSYRTEMSKKTKWSSIESPTKSVGKTTLIKTVPGHSTITLPELWDLNMKFWILTSSTVNESKEKTIKDALNNSPGSDEQSKKRDSAMLTRVQSERETRRRPARTKAKRHRSDLFRNEWCNS
ncbi:hypothetical protein COOONC_21482 [Cooperia oncophora]